MSIAVAERAEGGVTILANGRELPMDDSTVRQLIARLEADDNPHAHSLAALLREYNTENAA